MIINQLLTLLQFLMAVKLLLMNPIGVLPRMVKILRSYRVSTLAVKSPALSITYGEFGLSELFKLSTSTIRIKYIMKTIINLLIVLLGGVSFAQVGIGTANPDASAALDIESTEKGFLPPRMTEDERGTISTPASGLIVWCTNCGSDGEMQVFNGTTWTNLIGDAAAETPPQVGDFRDGGVVFYVAPTPTDLNGDGDPDIGLVCAVEDQSVGIQWSNGSNTVTGATATAIGAGAANTTTIIQEQGATQTNYAAGLAKAYNGGGFNDWFLPSKDEFNEIYQNRTEIDNTSVANGGSNLAGYTYYWSSTETAKKYAWIQPINFGSQSPYGLKSVTFYNVRAIRAFKIND